MGKGSVRIFFQVDLRIEIGQEKFRIWKLVLETASFDGSESSLGGQDQYSKAISIIHCLSHS